MTEQINYKKEISLRTPGLNRGFFIALEGLDGAGKSTMLPLLAEALREAGYGPKELKEPTDGPWGQKIRRAAAEGRRNHSPETELGWFVSDRAEDVAQNIGPALLAGRPVLIDRYILSNVAYQSALGLDEKHILRLNERFPWPDLIVILEIPVETGLERIKTGRAGGLDEAFELPAYLNKVKESFDRQQLPGILRLDGRLSPPEILAQITAELGRLGFLPKQKPDIIDSHCHLCASAFKYDLDDTLKRARAVGLSEIINVGLGPENCREVMGLSQKEPWCRPVLGWHPHDADEFSQSGLKELVELASDPQVVGFGEIGLDFALMHSEKSNQLKAFEALLEAAVDLNKPIVVHSRDAFAETCALLKKYAFRLTGPGVIHCFTRDWSEARAYLDLGFYLSLPGVVTFPKNGDLREVAARTPADRLLVETDAPYLAPMPFRGKRNEPSYLIYHLQALADARGISLFQAAALTSANARKIFSL